LPSALAVSDFGAVERRAAARAARYARSLMFAAAAAGPQPAAHERFSRETTLLSSWRLFECYASRSRPGLGMVGVDVVGGDVGHLVGIGQKLAGDDVGTLLYGQGEIAIGLGIASLVFDLELDALVVGAVIIEARQPIGLAELPVIEQVAGDRVIGIQT